MQVRPCSAISTSTAGDRRDDGDGGACPHRHPRGCHSPRSTASAVYHFGVANCGGDGKQVATSTSDRDNPRFPIVLHLRQQLVLGKVNVMLSAVGKLLLSTKQILF